MGTNERTATTETQKNPYSHSRGVNESHLKVCDEKDRSPGV